MALAAPGQFEAVLTVPGEPGFEPLSVTYALNAPSAEGDPDYRQIVYVALAEAADTSYL